MPWSLNMFVVDVVVSRLSGPGRVCRKCFGVWSENCEGSISLTQRVRSSKKPSRMRVRSWKHQLVLPCPVKL